MIPTSSYLILSLPLENKSLAFDSVHVKNRFEFSIFTFKWMCVCMFVHLIRNAFLLFTRSFDLSFYSVVNLVYNSQWREEKKNMVKKREFFDRHIRITNVKFRYIFCLLLKWFPWIHSNFYCLWLLSNLWKTRQLNANIFSSPQLFVYINYL